MSEPDIARDAGPLTTDEGLAILDLRMAMAMKAGNYALHADLKAVSELIDTLAEERSAGGSWLRRMLRGSVESLSRLPT